MYGDRTEEGRGGGVMVLVKSGVKVTKVEYGPGKAEIMIVKVRRRGEDSIKVMTVYIPPRTSKLKKTEIFIKIGGLIN